MTVSSTAPGAIVFLQSASGKACAKSFALNADGKVEVREYGAEHEWNAIVEEATDLPSLATILESVVARNDMIAIVGALLDDNARENIPRKMLGAGPSLTSAERCWLPVDIDSVVVEGKDPRARVETLWRDMLPAELRNVDCWYQFTSSYGLPGRSLDELRVRLWFWLDAPIANEVVRQWAKALPRELKIDPSIYVAVQPVYLAAPRFKGMPDPLRGERFGLLAGAKRAVATAEMNLDAAVEAAQRHTRAGACVERKDVEPCEAQIQVRLEAIAAQASHSSRHFHALGAAFELYTLGAEPARIHEAIEDIMLRQGREPRPGEIAEMIRYAARKDASGSAKTTHTPLSRVLTDEWKHDTDEPGPDDTTGDDLLDEIIPEDAPAISSKLGDALNAQLYLKATHPNGGFIRWAEQDWEWNGRCWVRLENKEVLKHRVDRLGGISLSEGKAKACVSKIRGLCGKEGLEIPGWVSKGKPASHAMVMQNGMIFVDDALIDPGTALIPHDMDYFNVHVMPFDFDPKAKCPTWEKCVNDWFLDDHMQKREFQKIIGYLLIPDNRYEKFFVFTDSDGRAGKGTAVQVLCWLLGEDAVGATSFSGFAKDFGLGSLIGKSVALFNEANAQNQNDVPIQAVDRIKMITGNDVVEVERKGVDSVHRRLRLRLLMSCNRIPNFRDPSGALMKRMHLVEFKQSFYGRERTDLKERGGPLFKELPGILNWALRGLQMLYYEDKKFARPESTVETFEQIERVAAPMKAFAADCILKVNVGAGSIDKDRLYEAYCGWCRQKEGNDHPLGREKFFAELRLLCPHRIEQKTGGRGGRTRLWHGVTLTDEGETFIRGDLLAKDPVAKD